MMKIAVRMAGIGVCLMSWLWFAAVTPAQVNDELTNGLKEALKIGTANAVKQVSQLDGFYKNEAIKILLPENIQNAQELLKKAGFEALVNEFELSMNRAAEKASAAAANLFVDAIAGMTIDDALKILQGKEDEATQYFQEKTTLNLQAAFKPIIETAMSEVGVTGLYQNLAKQVTSAIPLGLGDLFDVDLNQYVTDRALEGLFTMLAVEEKKIRENPEARVTELLKKVFN